MLEVRILPEEPTPAMSYGTFGGNLPFHEEVSSAQITINRD
jgi:hypothetical protein